jgi:hypothetical protein
MNEMVVTIENKNRNEALVIKWTSNDNSPQSLEDIAEHITDNLKTAYEREIIQTKGE